jgi:hypothetical protein
VTSIDDYFSSLKRFLEIHKSIVALEPEYPFLRITDQTGRVNARLHFYDGSYLDLDEMIRIEWGVPVNYHYRYHYQRPDSPVTTYDDAPHVHEQLNAVSRQESDELPARLRRHGRLTISPACANMTLLIRRVAHLAEPPRVGTGGELVRAPSRAERSSAR